MIRPNLSSRSYCESPVGVAEGLSPCEALELTTHRSEIVAEPRFPTVTVNVPSAPGGPLDGVTPPLRMNKSGSPTTV